MVHCRTGSLEKDSDTTPARQQVSLPNRQLRKQMTIRSLLNLGSLPNRQLRNGVRILVISVKRSLPNRQLRNEVRPKPNEPKQFTAETGSLEKVRRTVHDVAPQFTAEQAA